MAVQPKSIELIDVQKEVIRNTVKDKFLQGIISSKQEYDRLLQDYLQIANDSLSFLKVRLQHDMTNASDFNASFEELSYDFASLFSYIGKVEEALVKHQRLNHSVIYNLHLRAKKVQDTLTAYERIADIKDSQHIYLETFLDSNSVDTDSAYFTDRSGNSISTAYQAKLDTELEAMKLPAVISENVLVGSNGVKLGKIIVRKQLGSELIRLSNPANDINNAVDENMETFWSESILVDAPLRVPMGADYYDVSFGALLEAEVQFDYLTQMNEIGMTVFGEYPLDIVAISYSDKDSGESEDEFIELVSPNQSEACKQSRTVSRTTSFQLSDVYAKRIRIIFNQRHYVKTEFITSQRDKDHLELWFHTREGLTASTSATLFQPVYDDKVEKMPAWDLFTKATDDPNPDIDALMSKMTDNTYKIVNKYEYNYGLYNLSFRKNEYAPIGVYLSKPIPVTGTARTFRLETKEIHPTVSLGIPITDIEYYVHDGRNWHSILPMNTEHVNCELLQIKLVNGSYKAVTRFGVDGELLVRKNGIDITSTVTLSNDNKTIVFPSYEATAFYTASYKPASGSWMLDFLKLYQDELGEVETELEAEEFRGTDDNFAIELSKNPFVDRKKLNEQADDYDASYLENTYLPIRVKLIDENGYHIEHPMNSKDTDVSVRNMTDYAYGSTNVLEPYNEEDKVYYQYRVQDNKIIFNTKIPQTTRVLVEYPWLVSHVRLKCILRRNLQGTGFNGLTPILEEYLIHFQTLT